ncbi:MAG: hypothetical protein P4L79_16990 [Legionella sp.]|uniref:hypothetical protein n=1 Tax=Legionella sp. TaxID=459 RepID=UPI00283E1AC3|nr:hypothetical protein [Legionella sp.]
MPVPFFILLNKKHEVPLMHSFKSEESEGLQLLVATGDKQEYRKKIDEYQEVGRTFRLTKGKVFETTYEDSERGLKKQTINVHVGLQVKGHSLTWYFWTKGEYMDQYPQDFRDELYNAAALAHLKVANGCDMYYRGSNAVHIKLMHHLEEESNRNHNHYRLRDNKSYTPEDFNQHLRALQQSSIHSKFFAEGEVDELCDKFATHYVDWTAKEKREMSQEEEYFSHPSQQLDVIDVLELGLFGGMQEPCRLNPDELKLDFEKAREGIKSIVSEDAEEELQRSQKIAELMKQVEAEYDEVLQHRKAFGSRGLHSAIASYRQIQGSQNEVVKANMGMDDAKGSKEHVKIPGWATKALDEYHKGMNGLITQALKRLPDEKQMQVVIMALESLRQLDNQPESIDTALEQIKKHGGIDLLDVSSFESTTVSGVKTTFLNQMEQVNKEHQQQSADVVVTPKTDTTFDV